MPSISVFNDVILPHSVIAAAGLRGRTVRRNTRTQAQSGHAAINSNWSRSLRQYDFGYVPMHPQQWRLIEGLHEVTAGGAYGFLLADPKDSTCDIASGRMHGFAAGQAVGTIGDAYGVPAYKLRKRMQSVGTTRTHDRYITRPIAMGSVFLRAGGAITMGAAPGQASLNADTGTLTFVADASQAIAFVTNGTTTRIHIGAGPVCNVGERLYLSGLVGPAAGLLNGLSHMVTAVDASSMFIGTSTDGYGNFTAATGTAARYAQPGTALTWAGTFYVPVHFASDELDWELLASGPESRRMIAGTGVILQEIRE